MDASSESGADFFYDIIIASTQKFVIFSNKFIFNDVQASVRVRLKSATSTASKRNGQKLTFSIPKARKKCFVLKF